jgi:hypothetical protein
VARDRGSVNVNVDRRMAFRDGRNEIDDEQVFVGAGSIGVGSELDVKGEGKR